MAKIESISATSTPLWLLVATIFCLTLRIGIGLKENLDPPRASVEIKWRSPDQLSKQDLEGSKLIFYDFRADWCQPCRQMDNSAFLSQDVVTELNNSFVPIRVIDRKKEDGKNNILIQKLEDRFSVQAFPSLVIAMPDGTKVLDHLGAASASSVKKLMQEALTVSDYYQGKEKLIQGDANAAAKCFDRFLDRTKWQHWRCAHASIFSCVAHREISQTAKAETVLTEALNKIHEHTFPYPILKYLAGKISWDELLKEASENKSNRLLCYAYAGIDCYAKKQFAEAKEKFDWVESNCDEKDSFEYRVTKAGSTRLKELGIDSKK